MLARPRSEVVLLAALAAKWSPRIGAAVNAGAAAGWANDFSALVGHGGL